MKPLLDKVLQGAGILTIGLMGLALIGLGYLFSWFALQFGIVALLGFLAFMIVIGFIQGSAEAIMLAPFRGLRRLVKGPKRQPDPTPETKVVMRKLSTGVITCFCIGAVVAVIQYLIGDLS